MRETTVPYHSAVSDLWRTLISSSTAVLLRWNPYSVKQLACSIRVEYNTRLTKFYHIFYWQQWRLYLSVSVRRSQFTFLRINSIELASFEDSASWSSFTGVGNFTVLLRFCVVPFHLGALHRPRWTHNITDFTSDVFMRTEPNWYKCERLRRSVPYMTCFHTWRCMFGIILNCFLFMGSHLQIPQILRCVSALSSL